MGNAGVTTKALEHQEKDISCASVSKRVYMRNLSYENEFCMQFHFHTNQSHFHKNGFALRLALKQRHKVTREWPVLEVGHWE